MTRGRGGDGVSGPVEYLCTLSGGYDSAVAMHWALERGRTRGLFIEYGQPYEDQEMRAIFYLMEVFRKHPNYAGVHWRRVALGMAAGTPWVPYRNLAIAAVATNAAVEWGAQVVVFGSKSAEYRPEDPISYLDSTIGFYRALEQLVLDSTEPQNAGKRPSYELPLVGWTKRRVMEYLIQPHVGVDLRRLWNCYRGGPGANVPCGECEHCVGTRPLIEDVLRGPTLEVHP